MATGPRSEGFSNILNNFDENDDSYLRYKMDGTVKNALEKCLQEGIRDVRGLGLSYWEPNALSSQNSEFIDYLQKVFSNAEVIPYTYYLKTQVLPAGWYYQNTYYQNSMPYPQTGALSTAHNVPYRPTDPTPTQEDATGYDDDENVLGASTFQDESVRTTARYFTGAISNKNITDRWELIKRSECSDIVVKPYIVKMSELPWSNSDADPVTFRAFPKNQSANDLFIPDDALQLHTYSKQQMIDMFGVGGEYEDWFITKFIEVKDNSNNGSYDEQNPRPYVGQMIKTDMNTDFQMFPQSTDTGEGMNSLVFFAKTKSPWYIDDDGSIILDSSKEHIQYWMFSLNSILHQRWFLGQYTWTGVLAGDAKSQGNYQNRTKYRDGNCVGLTLFGTNKVNMPVIITYFPPFGAYLQKTTGNQYFSNCDIISNYSTFSPATEYDNNRDWTNNIATQNGTTVVFSSDAELLDFLHRGLGLKATLDSDEFGTVDSDDWDYPIPEDVIPGSGGQQGGWTGGGFGSNAGESYDDIGNAYTATSRNYLSNSWLLNYVNVNELQKALVSDDVWSTITNLFKNRPTEGIINLIRFPIDFDNYATISDRDISVLGVTLTDYVPGSSVEGTQIPGTMQNVFYLGHFDFPERFATFVDYENTQITMYLPFVGFQKIDTDSVMNRRVHVYYSVDFGDGSCKAIIRVSNKKADGNFNGIDSAGTHPVYVFNGQMGEYIPLSTNNAQDKNMNVLSQGVGAFGSAIKGGVTGGPAGAVAGAAGGLVNMATAQAQKLHYTAGGATISGETYAINDARPFVIIDFVEMDMPVNYPEFNGYVTNLYDEPNNLKGYTQFDDVKVKDTTATDNEIEQLKSLLEGGVIIL